MGETRQYVWLVIGRDESEWLARTDGARRVRRQPLRGIAALSHDGAHAICTQGQDADGRDHRVVRLSGERELDLERACVAAVREDEATVLSWLASSPTGDDRGLVVLAAFAHPNRALATRVTQACGEATPPWIIDPLVVHSRQVPVEDVARAARAHPAAARRALQGHLSPRSAEIDQIRALKLLFLLGEDCAAEARLLAATSQFARVRSELASFIAQSP